VAAVRQRMEQQTQIRRRRPYSDHLDGLGAVFKLSWSLRDDLNHLQAHCTTFRDYDCLAASRLARYSRSPNSTGLSASYLDSASEFSFDLAFANLAVTFTAPLAMK
jgi:hypothetical protein